MLGDVGPTAPVRLEEGVVRGDHVAALARLGVDDGAREPPDADAHLLRGLHLLEGARGSAPARLIDEQQRQRDDAGQQQVPSHPRREEGFHALLRLAKTPYSSIMFIVGRTRKIKKAQQFFIVPSLELVDV